MATTPSLELVGRAGEQARLVSFAARLWEGPGALLIRGEPGIGKTTLWRAGMAAAEREGARVLVSRCAEAEMPIPLGAIVDLLDPAFEKVSEALPEPQQRALSAALGIETDTAAPTDPLVLLRAFVAAIRLLAADRPVLVAVDDVQWLDPASRRALAFAARRAGESSIGVLATLRGGPETLEPLGLADALEPGGLEEIIVGPLSVDELQRLVRERFDVRIPRGKLIAVHEASGGNPMFALEFARAHARDDANLRAQLPVPSTLQELVEERVRRLPQSTKPLLELMSAVERPTPALLARALDRDVVEKLVHEAVAAGAIGVGGDGVVRFTHPLLASAVYFDMPSDRRRAVHLELAALVEDLEQRARHLALATSTPDATIADVVERAAEAAAARGAPDAAALLAAEAERLTPPVDGTARVRRAFAGAGFLIEAGDFAEARSLLNPLLDSNSPAAVRSEALVMRSETEYRDRARLRAFLQEAIDTAPDLRVRWQAWIRYAEHGGFISADARTAAESAREARRIALELKDPPLIAASTAALAYYDAARGIHDIEFGEDELVDAAHLPRAAPWQITPAVSVGGRLLWAGELDRAREVLRQEYDDLVRQGRVSMLPLQLMRPLSDLEWRAGRWAEAERYAYEARAILEDGFLGIAHAVSASQIIVAGSLGRVDEARELASSGLRGAERFEDVNFIRIRWALGHVELAAGDPTAALDSLESLPQALDAFGVNEPGWQPILPDVIEALVSVGRVDEAEIVLQQLERQAAALEHRWATPAALRSRALLLLARERSDEAASAAEQAAAAFADLGFPLDRARSFLAAGSARRRAGQRRLAAELLTSAIAIFDELGAPLWLERAGDELRRASPRPRRDRELTSAERRVAALVAQGHTNREVAAQLFTTVVTVEAHLTRTYRKLGIRSRAQLTRGVAEGTLDLGS